MRQENFIIRRKTMAKKRLNAIKQEREETKQRGVSRFVYVNTAVAERLGLQQYKVADGDNFVSILPPKKEDEFYGKKVFIHSNIGADNRVFLCPNKMKKKPCPICEEIARIRVKNPDDECLAVLRPRLRYLFFVVDVTSKETIKKGVMFWDAPTTVKDEIVSLSQDRRSGKLVDVSDPDDGRDILFTKSGKGLKTRYSAFELEEREPIPDEWIKQVCDFEKILNWIDYETMSEEFLPQTESPEEEMEKEERFEDEDVEEEKPRRTSKRERTDEDGEEEDNFEGRKRNIRSRIRESNVIPEDEDGEEDGEEEEDAKPRRRVRGGR